MNCLAPPLYKTRSKQPEQKELGRVREFWLRFMLANLIPVII